ncbi:hypothetical protein [Streptomyces sp. B3I8]|uniref:hypothetical protein n=1 Tax=Streptomyces sp. B3I8 TaxID=3042303 RepID=UPI00278511D5|nr:hypothetical protein [Streptomyces sp. B3I8]MDQ0784647.1 hypothetical protein [Streptomyces sp. B3I8]
MLEQVWLHPPLAFARLGPSPVPCDNYRWGPSDVSVRGTGKTTVAPEPTLDLAPDGTLSERLPERVRFKDADGWRPVCPYFELHGTWTRDRQRHTGRVTPEVLAGSGLSLADVRWVVTVANFKAHHITRADGDRIEGHVEFAGDDHRPHNLNGRSPDGVDRPLVPPGRAVPLGSVQLPAPNRALPELRLRFTPAAGLVYGPTDLAQRTNRYTLPPEQLVLNANAVWCGFALSPDDPRTAPAQLFAGAEIQRPDGRVVSLGMIDDVCDGLVRVTLPNGLTAAARIVVGPPDFAPDRRPFVSIADGLADRVGRADVRDPAYLADPWTSWEVRDLFERILETVGAINLDAQIDTANLANTFTAFARSQPLETVGGLNFPHPEPLKGLLLALTERARRRHRRFVALEVLEDVVREQPDLIDRVIRKPMTEDVYYDRRMPITMRGADSYPLHLTRRQYDLLTGWARTLRAETEEGT